MKNQELTEIDNKVKIWRFQSAIAKALLEKGGFTFNESWYQELTQSLLSAGLLTLRYEDAVIGVFLGWDLVDWKKKKQKNKMISVIY